MRHLALGLAAVVVAAAVPSGAATLLGVQQATFSWAPSAGTVAGYIVLASRNGGPETVVGSTTQPRYTIVGEYGDSVVLRVRGYATDGNGATTSMSEPSEPSEPIEFAEAPTWPSNDLLALHCGQCERARLLSLATPGTPYDVPVLPAEWKPIGVGWNIVGAGRQIAWQNALSGQLAVTALGPDAAVPIAISTMSGMSVRRAVGLADLDGNGADSILLRDDATGRLESWVAMGSLLVRQVSLPVPAHWRFVQSYDLDGDGADEIVWQGDAANDVRISRGSGSDFVASYERFQVGLAGEPVRVADFDGNGEADVLFRDGAGRLAIAYFDAAGLDRQEDLGLSMLTSFFLLPTRVSARLDGQKGEDIVVQHSGSKAIYMIRPRAASGEMVSKLFDVDAAWEPFDRLD